LSDVSDVSCYDDDGVSSYGEVSLCDDDDLPYDDDDDLLYGDDVLPYGVHDDASLRDGGHGDHDGGYLLKLVQLELHLVELLVLQLVERLVLQ